MLRVGLTGGIGSGKSTVARVFTVLGVPVFDADTEAKALMVADPALRDAISARFGAAIYQDGTFDRKTLSSIVFNDDKALEDLNALVHPLVRKAFAAWATGQQAQYVIMEAALMAENDGHKQFDRIIAVQCPEAERIRRVMERDGVHEDAVRARMSKQATEEQRQAIAQYFVRNDSTVLVIPQVLAIHKDLLTLAAA